MVSPSEHSCSPLNPAHQAKPDGEETMTQRNAVTTWQVSSPPGRGQPRPGAYLAYALACHVLLHCPHSAPYAHPGVREAASGRCEEPWPDNVGPSVLRC